MTVLRKVDRKKKRKSKKVVKCSLGAELLNQSATTQNWAPLIRTHTTFYKHIHKYNMYLSEYTHSHIKVYLVILSLFYKEVLSLYHFIPHVNNVPYLLIQCLRETGTLITMGGCDSNNDCQARFMLLCRGNGVDIMPSLSIQSSASVFAC